MASRWRAFYTDRLALLASASGHATSSSGILSIEAGRLAWAGLPDPNVLAELATHYHARGWLATAAGMSRLLVVTGRRTMKLPRTDRPVKRLRGRDCMKVLAVSNNTGDPTPHIPDEMRRITELQAAGVIEQLYLKADRSGAVILLATESGEEAERQLATLPLVQRGVTSFQVTELVPAP